MPIRQAAICGMGALGLLYGTYIIDHGGGVHYVMDAGRLAKYGGRVFSKNGTPYRLDMRDGEAEQPVDLLIVAVKGPALAGAMEVMRRCVSPSTVILSVMNGISSEEILADRFGSEHLIYAVAQGMDAVKQGEELHYTNIGQLILGVREACQQPGLQAVCDYFDRIRLPYVVEEDIQHRMWGKLMLNVGVNQACMVYEADYGQCLDPGTEAYRTMVAAMREVIAVAQSEGITLREADLSGYVRMIATLEPRAVPSMRQDALAKRPSEVEFFAGTICRLARKHDLLVPTNDYLLRRIREIEAGYGDASV